MAYVPDTQETVVAQFKGSAQAVDPYSLDPAHGLYSQNVGFVVGPDGTTIQTRSRLGIAQVAQIPSGDGKVTAFANWYFTNSGSQVALIIYYAPNVGVKVFNQGTSTFTAVLVSVTGSAFAVFAFNGIYAYCGFGDATGHVGTSAGYIVNGVNNTADQLFTPPPAVANVGIVINASAGAGNVTAGTHRVGFLCTDRNGFTTLAPVASISGGLGTFSPSVATAPDGTHAWSVSYVFSTIPAVLQGGSVQVVMTSAANPQEYYAVPGAKASIPNASSGTVGPIAVNINDGDLTATGTNVTFYQNLLTQDLSNNPPFKPFAVFTYSSRMAYCTYDLSGFPVVYFSDQNDYQHLTAAYHGIYLEGRQVPVTGASLGSVCYIATLSALYMTQDNGGYPGTWTPPARVDGSVGVLAASNMLASGGKLALASEKGLFFYRGGSFPKVPISYWQQPDWDRINWIAPAQVQVVDDELKRVIRVLAPLTVVVTGASNTNPITITTAVLVNGKPVAYPHLFQTGLNVTITGVSGNTAANTTQNITVTGANTFTIPVAGNGAYVNNPATGYSGLVTPNAPNAEMSWNYSEGEEPGQLYYSLNAFSSYRQGCAGVVRNIGNNLDEVWYMPNASSPGNIVRTMNAGTDATPNRDVDMSGSAVAVNSAYETGVVPGHDPQATVHDFHGAHIRVNGNGGLALVAYGLDHVRSVTPALSPLTLALTPGMEYLVKWWMRNEQESLSFGTNAVDAWWMIAMLKLYWTPSLPFR